MKLLDSLKSLKPLEIGALVVFILFIILPARVPIALTGVFDSPIGILGLLVITIALFIYSNPVLGVVFILVAYELIRRGALNTGKPTTQLLTMENTNQASKDEALKKFNSPQEYTLEEEVIQKMAPASQNFIKMDGSDYKPVMEQTKGASLI